MKKGIDVSKWQGDIEWEKVKNDGIEFAIIRIGYGKYDNQKDSCFERNYKGAKKVGIKVGVYHYSYAISVDEAKIEAAQVLMWLKNKHLDLPIYFDIEDKCQVHLNKNLLNDICKAFCNRIEVAGYWAGIYSSKNWATNIISGNELGKRYTYWVAQYNNKCTYNGPYDMWQYSSVGIVTGIEGFVDLNYMYRNLINEIDNCSVQKINNYYQKYYGNSVSLVDALKSIDINSSFTNRKRIAKKNGINNYSGMANQNTELLNLLKIGKLKK